MLKINTNIRHVVYDSKFQISIFVAVATRNPRNEIVIKKFGKNVRKYREAKGLTMLELANLCEVELGTISTVERGIVNCTISTAHAIANALDVSLNQLFED